jgi:hypothetical protein
MQILCGFQNGSPPKTGLKCRFWRFSPRKARIREVKVGLTSPTKPIQHSSWLRAESDRAGSRSIFAQLAIVVLCAAVVWLAYKAPLGSTSKDPARVELLPFDNTPPSWDGAYPFVVIRQLNSDPRHPRFSVTRGADHPP